MSLRTAFALSLCWAALAHPQRAAAQDAGAPRFLVDGKDGPLAPAAVTKLTSAWALERAGSKETIAATDWVSLEQDGRARPGPLRDPLVLLGNGDRLPIKLGRPIRLQEARLVFTPGEPLRPQTGAELSLFRPHVALVLLAVPEGVDDVEALIARLHREPRDRDVVLLRNGDHIEGTVDSLNETDGCTVVADGEKIVTAWPKLAGVAFATTSLARPRPKKLHALAVLSGGARVHFSSLQLDAGGQHWRGRSTTGADLTLPVAALIALDIAHGRALYLSEVPPLSYKHTPYLGVSWPLGVDATLDGLPLRVGSDTFDRGLCLHGRSRASYWLDGKFSWFEAVVGLDPSTGPKGRAQVALIIDGKRVTLADGKELTAVDAPVRVRLDVRGARSLVLVVDNGSLGDVQARVNWGGARLLRSKP